jgi:flagellar biosynthesis protein FliQ
MTTDYATYLFQEIIWQSLVVVGPFLILAVVIGLIVSLLQTVTSLQDQTLSFVPKIVGVAALGWIIVPWLLQSLTGIVQQLWTLIPQMAP